MAKVQQDKSQDKNTATANTWQFHREGHKGVNFAGMGVEDFPDGMTLNVPREGINPHEFAKASANERNLHNAWELVSLRAQTAQKAALASIETGRAVQAEIGAAASWQDVTTAKIGLETAQVNTQIAGSQLNIRRVELDVVQYTEEIAYITAPARKATALIQGLNIEQQFLASAAQLIKATTDRDTELAVLNIQGYNVQPIPLPDLKSLPLPSFEFPSLDQVMSQTSRSQTATRETE